MLRPFLAKHNLGSRRGKRKEIIAVAKYLDDRHDPSSKDNDVITKNHRSATTLRVVSTIFHDNFFEHFQNHNTSMSRVDFEHTGFDGQRSKRDRFWRQVTEQALDKDSENFAEQFLFEENAPIADAVARGFDLKKFSKSQWPIAVSLFKKYDEALERFTKSGSHGADLFEDGYTSDIDVYYYHLHLRNKPNSHRAVTTRLNADTFYELSLIHI